jgi:hypothetical protein
MRGDGACGGQGSAQSPSPNQSPISAARTYESDPGADLRDRVQGRVRFSLDPGVRVQGRARFALDPRVRVQGRVRFALDRGNDSKKESAICFGPESPSPRTGPIWQGIYLDWALFGRWRLPKRALC